VASMSTLQSTCNPAPSHARCGPLPRVQLLPFPIQPLPDVETHNELLGRVWVDTRRAFLIPVDASPSCALAAALDGTTSAVHSMASDRAGKGADPVAAMAGDGFIPWEWLWPYDNADLAGRGLNLVLCPVRSDKEHTRVNKQYVSRM